MWKYPFSCIRIIAQYRVALSLLILSRQEIPRSVFRFVPVPGLVFATRVRDDVYVDKSRAGLMLKFSVSLLYKYIPLDDCVQTFKFFTI